MSRFRVLESTVPAEEDAGMRRFTVVCGITGEETDFLLLKRVTSPIPDTPGLELSRKPPNNEDVAVAAVQLASALLGTVGRLVTV